ncbi:MAG: type I-A CRISPR-associated protein Cas5a [Thermoproteus sp.]
MAYFVVDLAFPLFSIKELDVYQVAASAPLPSPSSIVGAVGAAMGRAGLCRGAECLDVARNAVKVARPVAVGRVAKSPVVLRRARGVLEERALPGGFAEFVKFSDAMSREYVFAASMKLLIVGDVEPEVLYLIDRLGDSESLAAVVGVRRYDDARSCGGGVNVPVAREVVKGGSYTLVKMADERGKPRYFALPVVRSGGDVYQPSAIEVDRGVLCVEDVRFPENKGPSGGYDW